MITRYCRLDYTVCLVELKNWLGRIDVCHIEAEGLWAAQKASPRAFAVEGGIEAELLGAKMDEYGGKDPPPSGKLREADDRIEDAQCAHAARSIWRKPKQELPMEPI